MEILRVLPAPRHLRPGDEQAWTPQTASPLSVWDLGNVLRRRLALVLAIGLVGAGAAFATASYFQSFNAKALILVEALNKGAVAPSADDQIAVETHVTSLQAQSHLAAIRKSFGPAAMAPSLHELTKNLKIQQELHSRVIAIGFSAKDAVLAAEVANRTASIYIDRQNGRYSEEITRKIARLREKLAAVQADIADPSHIGDEATLKRRMQELAVLLRILERQREDLEREPNGSSEVSLLSPAFVPDRPSTGTPALIALPAFVAFAIFGFLLALYRERADQTLRSENGAEESLGIPCTGLLPHLRAACDPHAILRDLGKPCAFSIALKAIAFKEGLGTPGHQRIVLVTSALPREGKSTLALALSGAAAHLGRRTLLITAGPVGGRRDRRANAGKFPVENERSGGFPEAPATVLGPNLDCLAGADAEAMLSGSVPADDLGRLKQMYELVVIDGPSLLRSAEAVPLSALADRILIAVRWGRTGCDFVAHALRALPAQRVGQTATVLTRVHVRRHALYRFGDRTEALSRFRRRPA